ncbi:MAG: hypothetical protein HW377_2239 [Actinobacteria bacterium]|nr:hypothetical protein [Actinomycetota bacterium]
MFEGGMKPIPGTGAAFCVEAGFPYSNYICLDGTLRYNLLTIAVWR